MYKSGAGKWATNTVNKARNGFFLFQADNNLVVYGSDGQPKWSSGTNGRYTGGNSELVMQSDGNLVLYGAQHQVVWATGRK